MFSFVFWYVVLCGGFCDTLCCAVVVFVVYCSRCCVVVLCLWPPPPRLTLKARNRGPQQQQQSPLEGRRACPNGLFSDPPEAPRVDTALPASWRRPRQPLPHARPSPTSRVWMTFCTFHFQFSVQFSSVQFQFSSVQPPTRQSKTRVASFVSSICRNCSSTGPGRSE